MRIVHPHQANFTSPSFDVKKLLIHYLVNLKVPKNAAPSFGKYIFSWFRFFGERETK